MRSLYKDLVWLMNRNSLIETDALKRKVSILPLYQCSIVIFVTGVKACSCVLRSL